MSTLNKVWNTVIIVVVFFLLQNTTNGQQPSPCPRLFTYEAKGPEPDRWYGILTLLTDSDLQGVWLRVIFDRPSLQLGNWFGEVVTQDNKDYLIKNRNFKLKAHTPHTVRFFMKYDVNQPVPSLVSFRLNAKTVCPEGVATEPPPTSENVLYTNSEASTTPQPEAPAPPPPPVQGGGGLGGNFQGGGGSGGDDFFPGDFWFLNRPGSAGNNEGFSNQNNLNAVCGRVSTNRRLKRQYNQGYNYYRYNPYPSINQLYSYFRNVAQPTPLITYGTATSEGQFPWHTALYHAKGIDLAYICGASLISQFHVITVAHCVTRRRSQAPLNPDSLVVYLGKYYLKKWSNPGIQDRQVSKILPHPQYNAQTYSNDIAIIKMSDPIKFTDFVRPICLWDESTDLNAVVNKLGTVVGWGFDETGRVTEQLTQAQMPVVTQETCIYSFPDFFSRFTSSKTYCAGFRNGTSVCNGDSGGGMVFPKSNSNPRSPIWQLRGLVSISVALQNQFRCDASHYVVFTDIAKYLDWIKRTMAS